MNRLKSFFFLLFIGLCASCNVKENSNPEILIETRLGEIRVELYPEKAPKTVAAFQQLVQKGVYNGSFFYRVLKSEQLPSDFNTGIIQGGVYGSKEEFPFIPHETTRQTGLSHTSGTISMARTKPGTASSEFFICIGDQSPLDAGRRGTEDSLGMAAFGKVVKGMDVVKKIHNKPSEGDAFIEKTEIQKIKWIH